MQRGKEDRGEFGELVRFEEHAMSLWSKPFGEHLAEEEDEDEVEWVSEEALMPQSNGAMRHLCSTRTRSWATAPENSFSGRVYQNVMRSQTEYSDPSINIRSQRYSCSSSQRPLQPAPVQSLMRLIPGLSKQNSNPRLTNSQSLKEDRKPSILKRLTG
ncbi:putative movement protein [Artemisia virus B]|uniref:Movement protein n=1 Tax=Artemisia virus B TaxID=2812730 RepID=A0A894JAB7_9VIRU|nr:putative movement protein [Artemisia virus B]